ncbi:MAG: tripartite tricarboxylate transporter TctB family protein [Actinomycetaceae bacterium]
MGDDERLNLISSALLTALATAILAGGVAIYARTDQPLHASPALMPGLVGVALLACSLLLLGRSLRGTGLRARWTASKAWIVGVARHPDTRTTIIGLLLMAVYSVVLVRVLQFWAASFIFAVAMLLFLRAVRWYWALLIAGATVGGIVVLFGGVFNIPLP